jgi:peptidyl-prolyl cis-trans isomerase B (cyclophilin B)
VPTTRLLPLAVLPLLVLASACGGSDDGTPKAAGTPTASASSPTPSASSHAPSSPATSSAGSSAPAGAGAQCSYPKSDQESAKKGVHAPPAHATVTTATRATIGTNRGAIPVTLEADKAPCTVNSFLSLADQGYFDDTSCHRLTTAGIYVLQCGDPTGTGTGSPGYTFPDELVKDDPRLQPCRTTNTSLGKQDICTYPAGTVAMANAGPDTNGSQFFLVYKDSPLPNAYTVFGRMDASGLKVVQDVAKAGISNESLAQGDGPPAQGVTITSVKAAG